MIDTKRPATFLIETVPGLRTQHPVFYNFVIKFLQHLKDPDGSKTYKVRAQVVDTKVSGGLPQSRSRVYIVGWQRKKEVADFMWPRPLRCASLRSLMNVGKPGDSSELRRASKTLRENLTRALQAWKADPELVATADEVCCA